MIALSQVARSSVATFCVKVKPASAQTTSPVRVKRNAAHVSCGISLNVGLVGSTLPPET